jgi:hypothetical protein
MPEQRKSPGRKLARRGAYRRPMTTQEKRANQEGWERPVRRPVHLPDRRDRMVRADFWDRSWKRYRRTQYHPKGLPAEPLFAAHRTLFDISH